MSRTNTHAAPGNDDQARTMPHSDTAIPCCAHCADTCQGEHIVMCMCQRWALRRKDKQ